MAGELHDFEPASSAFAVAQAVGEIPNALAPLDNKLPELICSPCRSDVAFDDDRALAVDVDPRRSAAPGTLRRSGLRFEHARSARE